MTVFVVWLALSVLAGVIATNKGRAGFGFFVLSVLLSPLIGLIAAVIATPHTKTVEAHDLQTGAQVVEIQGIKIEIPEIASEIIREAIRKGSYEADELKLVKSRLGNDDVVMEVGTGLGLISAYCAKRIGNDRVFTFEANPVLEAAIRRTYVINHVAPTLTMCLIGDHDGVDTLYVRKDFWSSSIIERQGAVGVTVPVRSFNERIRAIDPTFLLLDIEGGEYALAQYADFHNVAKLMIELHSWIIGPEKIQFVRDKLGRAGFRLVQTEGDEQLLYYER